MSTGEPLGDLVGNAHEVPQLSSWAVALGCAGGVLLLSACGADNTVYETKQDCGTVVDTMEFTKDELDGGRLLMGGEFVSRPVTHYFVKTEPPVNARHADWSSNWKQDSEQLAKGIIELTKPEDVMTYAEGERLCVTYQVAVKTPTDK